MSLNVNVHPKHEGGRPNEDPLSRKGAPNTIELRVKSVDGTGDQAKHYFAVYTDENGKQYYLGGYPEHGSLPNQWGQLITREGEYVKGTSDFAGYQKVATISGDPASVREAWNDMSREMREISAKDIPYLGVRNNSNAAMITAAENALQEQLGASFDLNSRLSQNASDVLAPGSDQDLDNTVYNPGRDAQELLEQTKKLPGQAWEGTKDFFRDLIPENQKSPADFLRDIIPGQQSRLPEQNSGHVPASENLQPTAHRIPDSLNILSDRDAVNLFVATANPILANGGTAQDAIFAGYQALDAASNDYVATHTDLAKSLAVNTIQQVEQQLAMQQDNLQRAV
jgi:hypothetical protein